MPRKTLGEKIAEMSHNERMANLLRALSDPTFARHYAGKMISQSQQELADAERALELARRLSPDRDHEQQGDR